MPQCGIPQPGRVRSDGNDCGDGDRYVLDDPPRRGANSGTPISPGVLNFWSTLLKRLEDENTWLKRLLAEAMLGKAALSELLAKMIGPVTLFTGAANLRPVF